MFEFLLSEQILCKESIVIVKKLDFEILEKFIRFQASGIHLSSMNNIINLPFLSMIVCLKSQFILYAMLMIF